MENKHPLEQKLKKKKEQQQQNNQGIEVESIDHFLEDTAVM